MPEWLAVIVLIIAYAQGVMLGGILWGTSPFWDGVRSFYRFGR
jgi:hypothetical protein